MGNFVYNIAKGKVAEYASRINLNDPVNSVFLLLAYNATATDATLMDLTTIAAVEADPLTAEVTNVGYARKVLSDLGGITITVDNTNDRVDVDTPDQTWTAVAVGTAWTDLVFGYDSDSTTGTDANVVPVTQHDFVVTPDGSDITAQIVVFYRAS